MPKQITTAAAHVPTGPWVLGHRPLLAGCLTLGLLLAIAVDRCWGEEPGGAGRVVLAIRDAPDSVSVVPASAAAPQESAPMPEVIRADNSSSSSDTQGWRARPLDRVAQAAPMPEVIRPGIAAGPGLQQGAAAPPPNGAAQPAPQPPDVGRMGALGQRPELRAPVPSPKVDKKFRAFVESEDRPEKTLDIIVGRDVRLKFPNPPRRVFIPDEETVEYLVITPNQLKVVGKKQGSTVLELWFPDPAGPNKEVMLSYLVRVLPDMEGTYAAKDAFEKAMRALDSEINSAFPESDVRLSFVGEDVVVRGEAKDVIEAYQILRVLADTMQAIEMREKERRQQQRDAIRGQGRSSTTSYQGSSVETAFVAPGVAAVASDFGLNVAVLGAGAPPVEYVNAIAKLTEMLGRHHVVNLIRVPGEQQAMLMVTVAEVDRTAARSIGLDFSITKGAFSGAQNTGQMLNVGAATAGMFSMAQTGISAAAQALRDVGGNLPMAIDNGNILLAIQAMRTLNFARSLAEPNLVALNGQPASFQAGGSFPIPNSVILPGGAAQSVTYQNFGVSLQFTPYITDRDRVRLVFNASVSTPSTSTTEVSGAAVPSQITQRQFQTTVELREGQTLTVAGLIQNNFSGSSSRVPLWGDLPIIGRTGGLDNLASGEQELVVLVTPVLVHPLERCQTPPLPGNDLFEPTDVEFYLEGRLEGRRTKDTRASVRTDFDRLCSDCRGEETFIIGPQGATYGCCGCPPGCCRCPAGAAIEPARYQAASAVNASPDSPVKPPEMLPTPAGRQ
jgi:pilus assembly protein CpaC